jgi:hypothetical protein
MVLVKPKPYRTESQATGNSIPLLNSLSTALPKKLVVANLVIAISQRNL